MIWSAQTVATLIGSVVLPVAGWAVGAFRASKKQIADRESEIVRVRAERDEATGKLGEEKHDVLREAVIGLREAVSRMGGGLHDLEIKIAQQYATTVALSQMENRFSEIFTRFEEKLDRIIENRKD